MRKKENNSLVERLEEEIQGLEKIIVNPRLYNIKTVLEKDTKIAGKIVNFLIPFYIAAIISVTTVKAFGGGLPFYTDEISVDAGVKRYMDSTGVSYSSISYDEEGENKIEIEEDWHVNSDGFYEKSYVSYKYENLEDEKLQQIVEGEIDSYKEFLLEDYKKIEMKKELPGTENLKKDYKTIKVYNYYEDENQSTIRDESTVRNIGFSVTDIVLTGILGGLGCLIRRYKVSEKIKNIKSAYRRIDEDDVELLKQKVKIKKKNLETLKR